MLQRVSLNHGSIFGYILYLFRAAIYEIINAGVNEIYIFFRKIFQGFFFIPSDLLSNHKEGQTPGRTIWNVQSLAP